MTSVMCVVTIITHFSLLSRPVRPIVDVVAHGGALKETVHPVTETLQQLLLKQNVAVVVQKWPLTRTRTSC